MKPFISIIIVTKNEETYINNCLISIFNLNYPLDKFEVIVIDGNSSDRTIDIVKKFPVNIFTDSKGLGHSRNLGIKESAGDYLASTDADCVVDKNWLDILVNEMENAPESVIAVGGPNLVFENDPWFSRVIGYLQETFFSSAGAPQSFKISQKKFVFGIPNCNVMYKKKILIQEGCFDNEINIGEDAELNSRLTTRGYKYLYIPKAFVWHHRPATLKEFIKKMYTYGNGMGHLIRHKKVLRWYPFLPSLGICVLLLAYPLSIFFPGIISIYFLGILFYLLCLAMTAAVVYKKFPSTKSLVVLILLPTQHLTYGIGFLRGYLGGIN